MTQDKTQIQWQPIIEIAVVMIMIFGSNIFLYLHTDSRSEENRRENTAILQGIQQEMKDFHGRLERQDAEFKAHLLYEHGKGK